MGPIKLSLNFLWHTFLQAGWYCMEWKWIGVIHKVSEAVGTPQWKGHTPLVQHLLCSVINVAYTRFKVDRDIMDALVHLVA